MEDRKNTASRKAEMGKRIAGLLEERGKTQVWLAEKMGISAFRLNRWVNGHNRPHDAVLQKLADVLDTTVESLTIGSQPAKSVALLSNASTIHPIGRPADTEALHSLRPQFRRLDRLGGG
jgi:transcriptional regulator with XRE-family HTH domain